jgi:hypothetical protein
MSLLTSGNAKLKKTAKLNKCIIKVFSLPAGDTCPFAGACKNWCYAKSGNYCFPAVKAKHKRNYRATHKLNFVDAILKELTEVLAKSKGKKVWIRLHDTGDFYNDSYINMWLSIMRRTPNVEFYAYTKSHVLFKNKNLPPNFTMLPSVGGTCDNKITGAHVYVFPERSTSCGRTEDGAVNPGDVEGNDDDIRNVLAIRAGRNVGLRAHGARKGRV